MIQMRRMALASLILTAACQPLPDTPQPGDAGRCDVTVSFGSVCCGIDRPTKQRITEYVAADRRVAGTSERRWDREGEIDLCIATRSDADGLIRDLTAMVPARSEGSSTGTTHLRRGE
jgi:hypothetical protein